MRVRKLRELKTQGFGPEPSNKIGFGLQGGLQGGHRVGLQGVLQGVLQEVLQGDRWTQEESSMSQVLSRVVSIEV